MPYAGYLLNPGDMFQVEPDSVLFATGARKESAQIKSGRKVRMKRAKVNKRLRLPQPLPALRERRKKTGEMTEVDGEAAIEKNSENLQEFREQRLETIDEFLVTVLEEFERGKSKLGAKRKQDLRALLKDARAVRARINRKSEEELTEDLKNLSSRFWLIRAATKQETKPDATKRSLSVYALKKQQALDDIKKQALLEAMIQIEDNRVDPSKPYATPWQPRPYMSPFAFIPRYLEVHHAICSAVYLRHPVARPGLAEVPTPFAAETQQLAFTWYLRRR